MGETLEKTKSTNFTTVVLMPVRIEFQLMIDGAPVVEIVIVGVEAEVAEVVEFAEAQSNSLNLPTAGAQSG